MPNRLQSNYFFLEYANFHPRNSHFVPFYALLFIREAAVYIGQNMGMARLAQLFSMSVLSDFIIEFYE